MPRLLQYEGVSLTSRVIRFMTWSSVSHTAWELDDGRVIEAWHKPSGVRVIKNFREGHTPRTPVRAYRVKGLNSDQAVRATAYMQSQVGKPYHVNGVLRFLSRRDLQQYDPESFNARAWNPRRWFCSELVAAALMRERCNLIARVPPWRISPALLNLSPLLELDEVLYV